ncbi:MAG: Wzz/FepE/Etk N-terminal domain-containing protein [Chloroflexi bacterium]|nr:Wzz/FepE/Etk N-terminal domain-containing protein [Chloroflexota bacterium]
MPTDEIEIDLTKYLDIVRSWLWLILLLPALAGAGGWLFSLTLPPVYEAKADIASVKSFSQISLSPDYRTLSEAQLTQGLDVTGRQKALIAIAHTADLASTVATELGPTLSVDERQVTSLIGMVKVSADGDLIRIQVQNRDPQKAAKIADAWASNFAARVNELYTETPTGLDQIQTQAGQAWQNYQTAEEALAQFVGQNRVDALTREIDSRQNTLADLYAASRNLDRLLQDSKALQAVVDNNTAPSMDAGNRLALLLIRANAAALSFSSPIMHDSSSGASNPAQALSGSSPLISNPAASAVQFQVSSASLTEASDSDVRQELNALIASLDARKKQIDTQLADPSLQSQLLALQKDLEQQTAKKQELTSARDLAWSTYKTMASKLEEVQASQDATGTIVRLAGSAVVPDAPIGPKKTTNALLAAAIGFILAVGIAFTNGFMDPNFQSVKEVSERLKVPVFELEMDPSPRGEIGPSGPRSSYYSLWARLFLGSKDQAKKTLLVASPDLDGRAGSFAASLGTVVAQSGRSVILVDTSQASPSLHRLFGLSNVSGWGNLIGEQDQGLERCLQRTAVEGLAVVTSGAASDDVTPATLSRRLPSVVERLRDNADIVIFVGAPLAASADALPLAKAAEQVLLLISPGLTARETAMRATSQIHDLNPNIFAIVLASQRAKWIGPAQLSKMIFSRRTETRLQSRDGSTS